MMARSAGTMSANGRAPRRSAAGYLAESERPWTSLLFVLPLLVAYELYIAGFFGSLLTGGASAHVPRITACTLIEELFALFGAVGQHLPALALVGMLIFAHLARKDPWRVRLKVLGAMVIESLAWAAPLLVLGWGVARLLPLARLGSGGNLLFLSLGAGLYEELLFRLIGVTLLSLIFRDAMRIRPGIAISLSISISAVLFALYHYLGMHESFLLGPFAFRTLAGGYLGSLYAIRGFGVTVGCHAAYDLLVTAVV
jgi:hypothetical protein